MLIGINTTAMDTEDVLATLEYASALQEEFLANHDAAMMALAVGKKVTYKALNERSRALYAELAEVRHSLKTGTLPLEGTSPYVR